MDAEKMTAMISNGLARQREEDRAAVKAAVLAVWESAEFDKVDDDDGAGMVADAVLAWCRDRYE